jgi:NADH-quinone oxidoreductase subunit A
MIDFYLGIFYDYAIVFFFFLSVVFIAALLFFFSIFISPRGGFGDEKRLAYECGFSPFEDSRTEFDVQYYLTGILFIVFDLEVIYLVPWFTCCFVFDWIRFYTYLFVYLFLLVGLVYEIQLCVLEWNSTKGSII